MADFTHFDETGAAAMVDVSAKPITSRVAVARGRIEMAQTTLAMIVEGGHKKGDVLGVARLAGIMGAKRTADLIPLCHPLALSKVSVDLTPDLDASAVEIEATAKVSGQTGVEMEALTAVSVTALTIYVCARRSIRACALVISASLTRMVGAPAFSKRNE